MVGGSRIVGWLALFPSFIASLALLGTGFIVQLVVDYRAAGALGLPAWYLALRSLVTSGVLLSLLLASLAVTPLRRLSGWQAIASQRRTLGFQSERFSVIYDRVDDPDKITLCNQRKLFSSGILAYKFDKQFHGPFCISPLIYGQKLIKLYRAWYDDRTRTCVCASSHSKMSAAGRNAVASAVRT